MEVTGDEGEPTRNVQGTRAVLARRDVQVGVGRKGWNGEAAAMELNHGSGVPA
jgi:hypothetical protein